jgi:hypothetical protein
MSEDRDRLAGNSNEEIEADDDVKAHMRDGQSANTNESADEDDGKVEAHARR